MSDVSLCDVYPANPHAKGLIRIARKAAARDTSLYGAGTGRLYLHEWRPYVYRGTGRDELTAFMDDEPAPRAPVPTRRQERMQRLAAMRLHDGPEPEGRLPYGVLTARQAAEQLGVTRRTVERYKAELAGRTP